MKPQSRIKKGKRFEVFIAGEIEKAGLGYARREIGSGSGKRKGDIFSNLPFLIEAKHQNRITLLDWIDQARKEAERGNYDPDKWILVFNDFRKKPEFSNVYAVIDFWQLLDLLKRNQEPRVKAPDRELRWKLERLIQSAKEVIREIKYD